MSPIISRVTISNSGSVSSRRRGRRRPIGPFQVKYQIIGGGGGGGSYSTDGVNYIGGGGGAGGFISSLDGLPNVSGGGSPTVDPFTAKINTTYLVTIGAGGAANASGSDSVFASITAVGGGAGGRPAGINGSNGGCGGGGGANTSGPSLGGDGTAGQGYDGADAGQAHWIIDVNTGHSFSVNNDYQGGGGGIGGAGGTSGNVKDGGSALWIHDNVPRGSGGPARRGTTYGARNPSGSDFAGSGSGGSAVYGGHSGVLYLWYPPERTLTNPGGGLTFSASNGFAHISAGTGNIVFE